MKMTQTQTPNLEPIDHPSLKPPYASFEHFPRYPKLRAAGSQWDYTPEQIAEIAKCANDPVYFIRNYCKIVHVDKGVVDFDMYPYQERIARVTTRNRYILCRLPRQSGKCGLGTSKIRVKHRKTGEIQEITIAEFMALAKNSHQGS